MVAAPLWPDDELERVRKLVEEGLSYREIAALVGKSKNAVLGVAWRNGFNTTAVNRPGRRGAAGDDDRAAFAAAAAAEVGGEELAIAAASMVLIGLATPRRWWQARGALAPGLCRWIPKRARCAASSPVAVSRFASNPFTCEAPAKPGSSYCAEHHPIVWTKPPSRK